MNRSLNIAAILTAAIVGSGAWLAVQAHGASAASTPGKASCCADKTGANKHACGEKDGCGCKHKGMNPEMAAKMAEMDKRMEEQAAKMNSAKGDDKVDAMAVLLNEMVARHGPMRGMGMNPEMAAKMAEMDKRMEEQAAKMNSAKGDDKVDAMAALLNEMLARHRAMHDMMRARHDPMCGGAVSGGKETEEKSEGVPGEQEHAH